MNAKFGATLAHSKAKMSHAPSHVSATSDTKHLNGGRFLRLIRGTMLDLVRRDGRDLTARQLTTLLTIYLHDEVYSVSMLAKMLNISRPGVTRILDRLVEANLVSRAEDAADRRRVLIYRTAEGAEYIDELGGVAEQVAAELAIARLV